MLITTVHDIQYRRISSYTKSSKNQENCCMLSLFAVLNRTTYIHSHIFGNLSQYLFFRKESLVGEGELCIAC